MSDFRTDGAAALDWVARYLEGVREHPVLPRVEPGEVRDTLPAVPPERAEPFADVLADLDRVLLPGLTHWNHPRFFAYFATSGSEPGILAELLAAALNVNAMLWRTSPAATELEEVTLAWLRQLLGLLAGWQGVMLDTASMSNMLAIAIAREALGLDIRRRGLAGRPDIPPLRCYVSEQTHSSLEKGAITLGLGQENVVKIKVDERFQMDPAALATAVQQDLAAGYHPFFVCATVGTTSTTALDPIPAIADIAESHRLWLHVDGAYGGTAAIVPEMQTILQGAERADSLVVNPHKWLFTPLDLSAFYTRHPQTFKQAFSLVPEYLRSQETDENQVTDFMDYGVQLGRRFRALKLWLVLSMYGREGLINRIREHLRLAHLFSTWVDASPHFERLAPTPLSNVCFRAVPSHFTDEAEINRFNEALLQAVNQTGLIFISHTKLNGKYTLRLAIGNIHTQEKHVKEAWDLLRQQYAKLQAA